MAKKEELYIGELERFGYVLRVVCKTREQCEYALITEYLHAYRKRNRHNPSEEELEAVDDDMYVSALELGKVDWS